MQQSLIDSFSDTPGSRNVVPTMSEMPQPLNQNQTPEWANQLRTEHAIKIQQMFYNDLFQYLSRQDKVFTATQVNAIKAEEMMLLSSIFGNMQAHKVNPILRQVYFLMITNKRIPEPPKGLYERDKYIPNFICSSVFARSLSNFQGRDAGIALLESSAAFINLGLNQRIDDPLDNYDWDMVARSIGLGTVHANIIRDKAKVADIRQARAEDAQRMQEEQSMLNLSEAQRNMNSVQNANNPMGINQTNGQ